MAGSDCVILATHECLYGHTDIGGQIDRIYLFRDYSLTGISVLSTIRFGEIPGFGFQIILFEGMMM